MAKDRRWLILGTFLPGLATNSEFFEVTHVLDPVLWLSVQKSLVLPSNCERARGWHVQVLQKQLQMQGVLLHCG